jgi:hypothetical protein
MARKTTMDAEDQLAAAKAHELGDHIFDAFMAIATATGRAPVPADRDKARQTWHAAIDKLIDFAMEQD